MARQVLTPAVATPRGTALTLSAVGLVADGNAIPGEGNIVVLYHNAASGGNGINAVAIAAPQNDNYLLTTTPGTSAPAAGTLVMGPFVVPHLFLQSDGRIWLNHAFGDAQLKVSAIQLPVTRSGEAPVTATPPSSRVVVPPVAVHMRGAALTWVGASANGHAFANSGATYLLVNNQSASALIVPISLGGKVRVPNGSSDFAFTAENLAVAANTLMVFGPLRPDLYNQADGSVYFGVSPQTSVTLATFEA